ncbi:MAG TPA: hypothetical protein PLP34_03865 [Chitinophagaceae bacterium]|nr:hypothetical protein [Chitinophagaceae bacterium]HNF71524.1 hypothetical protein [Chitinophagaceae bacterium]
MYPVERPAIPWVQIEREQIVQNGICIYTHTGMAADFLQDAYHALDIKYPKFFKMDRMGKLGILAAYLLVKQYNTPRPDPFRSGMLFYNASASALADKAYLQSMQSIPSPALFVYTLPNIVMGELAIYLGWKGENTFFVCDDHHSNPIPTYANSIFKSDLLDEFLYACIEPGEGHDFLYMSLIRKEDRIEMISEEEWKKIFTFAPGYMASNHPH